MELIMENKPNLVRQIEDGIWQFCIDHAKPINKNVYSARFGFTTKRDLLRRIYARGTNVYKIKDEAQIEKELNKSIHEFFIQKKRLEEGNKRENKIGKLPKWKRRIIIGLRRVVNYLLSKWI